MANGDILTRFLTVNLKDATQYKVHVTSSSPVIIAQEALQNTVDLKYSPIMSAYLTPGVRPAEIPKNIISVAFFLANSPYYILGSIKPILQPSELENCYFTEGLASILFLNLTIERAKELREKMGMCPFEYWPINNTNLDIKDIILLAGENKVPVNSNITLPVSDEPELAVYVEQIAASIASLHTSYSIYFPDEINTLRQITIFATGLVKKYNAIKGDATTSDKALVCQKKANAIISALVELSAALSYSVTQGTSGCLPILWNRSPFPHHSLLGIGGSVRALTKYTRYLESAFMKRSAGKVIEKQYSVITHSMPASVAKYNSGPEYSLSKTSCKTNEHFDGGGDFQQSDHVPLITHFSLRHGFMEAKFSVTAASESLTAETLPQWTLMTLSHEIMHSRVRTIFQALFGKKWDDPEYSVISTEHFNEFSKWVQAKGIENKSQVGVGLRNVILNFCYAVELSSNPISAKEDTSVATVTINKLGDCYTKHKQFSIEILVHFHDYYFAYACQPKIYIMSLWASWIKVAAPYARTREYLVRSLATVACGSGLEPRAAFDLAVDALNDGLDALEANNIKSPLFDELRRLVTHKKDDDVSKKEVEATRSLFKVCYYLIDQVRLFFASRTIVKNIDRLENDPFAEGSDSAEDYSANVYVFGDKKNGCLSPIRYSLAALHRTLSGKQCINDPQWLTAWNYIAISSMDNNVLNEK